MNIAFYTEHLSLRGTEIALFDYAKYNKLILQNESFILLNANQPEYKNPAKNKFLNEFGAIYPQKSIQDIENFIEKNKIDVFYKICAGTPEELPKNCKTVVHTVFPTFTPFGNVYAYVSEWLRDFSVPPNKIADHDFVPHIVELPEINDDNRNILDIPKNAFVFGCYGGNDSFDIEFVKRCIQQILDIKNDFYFLFLNIDSFISHKRVKFFPGTSDLIEKVKFINTCDAMIHARNRGETFGLAVAEFSLRNKKIITYGKSPERSHINILKEKAIIYNNENELMNIFHTIEKDNKEYNCYKDYNPHTIMTKFNSTFIKGK